MVNSNKHHLDSNSNSNHHQHDKKQLLSTILKDNKILANEVKNQLDIIEQLEKEKNTLKNNLNQIVRESELCIERDFLHTKRNVTLVRENKELKRVNNEMTIEIQRIKDESEKNIGQMNASFQEQRENMIWNHNSLMINSIQLQTELDQIKKEKKWLNDDNKRLKKALNKKSGQIIRK